jgi:ATP-dependent helicase/nuclease subunit A
MGFLPKSTRAAVLLQTQRNQAAAADPLACAWVSANAGTGKTHVVTMRVLRLLLAGAPPERILALTYTKAAAAEMSKRVFERLAEWVTAADETLAQTLAELFGRPPMAAETQRARQLFAIAIETPGGLKVQTIHAFCERLLQRFPLEAGVPPGFAILDDQQRDHLLKGAVDAVLTQAAGQPQAPLARALTLAAGFATETDFDVLLGEVLKERDWIDAAARLDRDGHDAFAGAEKVYRRALHLDRNICGETVARELDGLLTAGELALIRDVLASGTTNDVKTSQRVAHVLRAGGAAGRVEALCDLFLTTTGEARKALMTKGLAGERPEVNAIIERAQARFVALNGQRLKLSLLDASLALLRLGTAVMRHYSAEKARRAALDFDDLVQGAANLLGSSAAVEWVLYKLDGGLDHILVDEAQDTSPIQWEVIRALAEEFFAGSGARDGVRTLFAVGDEKQSIYGFQGAKPAMFAATGRSFAARAELAGLAWRRVPLMLSFRAVEPLSKAVDTIFQSPQRTPGVATSGEAIRHLSHRAGQAGLIEIWPTEKRAEKSRPEVWTPLAEEGAASPVARLAGRIATTIEGWLQSNELLASENRRVRAGDILILVRKRQPFAPAMVTALKTRGIRVAGADRLRLVEQIAVQDLLALGDVLCLPDDDLSLAAVLKSPLFGFDDDDLMAIAPERAGALWQALFSHKSASPRFQHAVETLNRWYVLARQVAPFEFFATLLDREKVRTKMLERLGADAADGLDEFLNLALAYDETSGPTLQGFLIWLREGAREIKRDMEQGRDEVRVMTVHGAKGLEAPIVFLPDTCTSGSGRRPGSLLRLPAVELATVPLAPFLWPVKGTSGIDAVKDARSAANRADAEERNRLLYVALTRARDRLYVAGFEGAKPPPPDCWYSLIKDGLADELGAVTGNDGRLVWQMRSEQLAGPEAARAAGGSTGEAAVRPEWAGQPAPPEPLLTIPLIPSHLADLEREPVGEPAQQRRRYREPPAPGPAVLAQEGRFLRGTLIHVLLERLPSLPHASRAAAAEALLSSHEGKLTATLRKDVITQTLRVLDDATFAPLFGPDSRAEVAIAAEVARPGGRGPALRVMGKIDRLAVVGDKVLIVDYKTNRPPPLDPARVAEAYLLQLAAYRMAVARIFPELSVKAAILWTEGPRIMEIAASVLDIHQHRLWELEPSSLDG